MGQIFLRKILLPIAVTFMNTSDSGKDKINFKIKLLKRFCPELVP